jgi:hypothetical protein
MHPLNTRTVCGGIALAACLASAALALRGCQPTGLGSIKVGSPSQWHKQPMSPGPIQKSKPVPRRTRQAPPADQPPYRSIKDQMKDRAMSIEGGLGADKRRPA